MATDTPAKLDPTSRRTIGRFILKLIISLLIAQLLTSGQSYPEAVSAWLAFYALFAMFGGLLIKGAIVARSLNAWDEASWLLLIAGLMHLIGRAVG